MRRIELYERYIANYAEIEHFENLGINADKYIQYKYRRIFPKLDDIETPIEIEGNQRECIIRYIWKEEIIVKANYDDLCILLNDLENSENEEETLGI